MRAGEERREKGLRSEMKRERREKKEERAKKKRKEKKTGERERKKEEKENYSISCSPRPLLLLLPRPSSLFSPLPAISAGGFSLLPCPFSLVIHPLGESGSLSLSPSQIDRWLLPAAANQRRGRAATEAGATDRFRERATRATPGGSRKRDRARERRVR